MYHLDNKNSINAVHSIPICAFFFFHKFTFDLSNFTNVAQTFDNL
jgi:hypothetical protein